MSKRSDWTTMKVDPEFLKAVKIESSLKEKSMLDYTREMARNKNIWSIRYNEQQNNSDGVVFKSVEVKNLSNNKKPVRAKFF